MDYDDVLEMFPDQSLTEEAFEVDQAKIAELLLSHIHARFIMCTRKHQLKFVRHIDG